jgi:hypothetical protein
VANGKNHQLENFGQ